MQKQNILTSLYHPEKLDVQENTAHLPSRLATTIALDSRTQPKDATNPHLNPTR